MAGKNNGKTTQAENVMMTRSEAAEYLNVAETYIGVLVKKDDDLAAGLVVDTWPGTKIKRWRISQAALDAFKAKDKDNTRVRTNRNGPFRKALRFESQGQFEAVQALLDENFPGLKFEMVWKPRDKATTGATSSTPGASIETVSSDVSPTDGEDYEEDYEDEDEDEGKDEGELVGTDTGTYEG
jgi:hypothetical protein